MSRQRHSSRFPTALFMTFMRCTRRETSDGSLVSNERAVYVLQIGSYYRSHYLILIMRLGGDTNSQVNTAYCRTLRLTTLALVCSCLRAIFPRHKGDHASQIRPHMTRYLLKDMHDKPGVTWTSQGYLLRSISTHVQLCPIHPPPDTQAARRRHVKRAR